VDKKHYFVTYRGLAGILTRFGFSSRREECVSSDFLGLNEMGRVGAKGDGLFVGYQSLQDREI